MPTKTAKTAKATANDKSKESTMKTKTSKPTASKKFDEPAAGEQTPAKEAVAIPAIDQIRTLSGEPLQEVYALVLGETPNPKAPVVALRRKIASELERRSAARASLDAVDEAAVETIDPAVALEPAAETVEAPAVSTGEVAREKMEAGTATDANEASVDMPPAEAASVQAPVTDDASVASSGAADDTPPDPEPSGDPIDPIDPAHAMESATEPAPTPADEGRGTEDAAAASPAVLTERVLPPIGTVLVKKDGRTGTVRCECKIVEGGVEYAGKVYKSLSAAALAASHDLGNTTKQTNGWLFWGLASAPRATAKKGLDLDLIERAWERYRGRAEAAVKSASDHDRAKLRELFLSHSTALFDLATPADTAEATRG